MDTITHSFINKIEAELYLAHHTDSTMLIRTLRDLLSTYTSALEERDKLIFERTSCMLMVNIHNLIKATVVEHNPNITPTTYLKLHLELFRLYNIFFNSIKRYTINNNYNNIVYVDPKNNFDYIKYYSLYMVCIN